MYTAHNTSDDDRYTKYLRMQYDGEALEYSGVDQRKVYIGKQTTQYRYDESTKYRMSIEYLVGLNQRKKKSPWFCCLLYCCSTCVGHPYRNAAARMPLVNDLQYCSNLYCKNLVSIIRLKSSQSTQVVFFSFGLLTPHSSTPSDSKSTQQSIHTVPSFLQRLESRLFQQREHLLHWRAVHQHPR